VPVEDDGAVEMLYSQAGSGCCGVDHVGVGRLRRALHDLLLDVSHPPGDLGRSEGCGPEPDGLDLLRGVGFLV